MHAYYSTVVNQLISSHNKHNYTCTVEHQLSSQQSLKLDKKKTHVTHGVQLDRYLNTSCITGRNISLFHCMSMKRIIYSNKTIAL